EQRLYSFIGREVRPSTPGPDPVNTAMIRHWCEAMGDANPIYQDASAAEDTGRTDIVAPAAMLQAWTMRGYQAARQAQSGASPLDELFGLLDEAGFTSVVATDSKQEFHRELVPGDRVSVSEAVESISSEKKTALGTGHFVTTMRTYRDQHAAVVATQRWTLLRFRPAEESASESESEP